MKEQGSIEENFDFSKYGFRHINKAVLESIYVVNKHKKGQVEYLPTKWKKLNSNLLGGLQKGKLYVVAGRPGSGKSAFSNQLVFDMMDMNLGKNIVVLYWNFEMPSYQQVLRMISKNVSKSMNQLLSVDTTLADQDFIAFTKAVQRYKDYPVYFNDIPRSIDFIKLTNEKFYKSNPKTTIVNIYDHTRLVRSNKAGKELERLTELSHTCMELQAKYKVINILLSQLNRNIEKDERRATLFQPMLSDLFGSDSIGQDAHVVMMINRPRDIYDIREPYLGEDTKNLLALHIEKNRDGRLGMLPFDANMKYFDIKERVNETEQIDLFK